MNSKKACNSEVRPEPQGGADFQLNGLRQAEDNTERHGCCMVCLLTYQLMPRYQITLLGDKGNVCVNDLSKVKFGSGAAGN